MSTDEIKAFQVAATTATLRGWPWRPPFMIHLEEGRWEVCADADLTVRVDVASGRAIPEPTPHEAILDPLTALMRARTFAAAHGLSWKPSFSLECTLTHWVVGACQAQFGGQAFIHVAHDGEVLHSAVNPK
ncbi:hypothetical protein [Piscinibacter gummiphilus]|nr:hypothetical protein [Piscinibacter gummiphilus]